MNVFRRKSVAAIQTEAASDDGRKRAFGALSPVALGVGAVIGTGIVLFTGRAATPNADPAVLLSFILAGLAALFAALCYLELAAIVPIAGGAYAHSSAAFGELVAWLVGWDLLLACGLGAVTVAVAWSGYVVTLLRDIGITVPCAYSAARGTLVACVDGSSATALFNAPAVVVVVLMIVLVILGIRASAIVNQAVVLICVVLYVAMETSAPGAWAPPYLTLGAVVGLSSVVLVLLFSQSRLLYAMACDGLMPAALNGVHSRFHTPYIASAVTGAVVAVTAALAPITDVADLATVAALIALVMVCVAAMVLRYRNPNVRRAFRAPVLWFIAPAGVVCALYVVRSLPSLAREGLLVWLALGLVPYALYGYRHARRDQAE